MATEDGQGDDGRQTAEKTLPAPVLVGEGDVDGFAFEDVMAGGGCLGDYGRDGWGMGLGEFRVRGW